MKMARVLILYTGGTIGMVPKDPGNPSSPLIPKHLSEMRFYMPDLERFERVIELKEETPFDPPLDSSDVRPSHWIEIADRIGAVYEDYDGFVILHGTDTMTYTASALSFIFENLSKPVVVTGSQLPMSAPRTDAISNLTNAIHIAGYKAFGLPRIPEVVICFADKVLRGNRATKVSSTRWAAFDSPNFPPLGDIGPDIDIHTDLLLPPPREGARFSVNRNLDNSIAIIGIFPGFQAFRLQRLINDPKTNGIIIRTYGAGNAPSDSDLLEVIAAATAKGKIILNISQCLEGMVEMGRYASSSGLLERGVVSGLDMTVEAAMAKLMWTLGTQSGEERITQLQISQRGEQTENLFDLRFGALKKAEAKAILTRETIPDPRFDTGQLSRAVLRLSNLGLVGTKPGEEARLKLFVNAPLASHETPESDDRCVGVLDFVWDGEPRTLVADITEGVKKTISPGKISLAIVSPRQSVKFYCDGLYLALFSRA